MIAPTMTDLLTAFRIKLLGDRRASRTVHTYTKIASAFLATSPNSPPTISHVDEFLGRPRRDGTRRAATARNQELAALRSLARVAVREKSWEANPTEGIEFVREAPRDPAFLGAEECRWLFLYRTRLPGHEVVLRGQRHLGA